MALMLMNQQRLSGASSHLDGLDAKPRTLHLQIIDLQTGQIKVVLRLPVRLVEIAQRLGAQLLPPGHTVDTVLAAAHHGHAQLQWVDRENNERLELTLELK
jgi:hypothetical protein